MATGVTCRIALCLALLGAGSPAPGAQPAAELLYTMDDLDGWVGAVAFSHDGQTLAAASGRAIRLVAAATGERHATLRGHDDIVCAVAFAPDRRLPASGSFDQTARLWKAVGDDQPLVLAGHRGAVLSVAFSPDGRRLASGGIDGSIRLWDASNGRHEATFEGHRSWVNGLAFSGDGARLGSASSDGTVKLWDIATWNEPLKLETDPGDGEVRSLAFAADGRWVAAGTRYGMVRVWATNSGGPLASFKAQPADVWAVACSADGRTLAAGGSEWHLPGEVVLWDTAAWRERARLTHTGEVLSLAFSRDGALLAAGSWNRSVRVWRLPSAEGVR